MPAVQTAAGHPSPPALITLDQFRAMFWPCSRSTVYDAESRGLLKLTRVGRRVYVARAEAERFVAAAADAEP